MIQCGNLANCYVHLLLTYLLVVAAGVVSCADCPRANNDDKMESSVPRRVARPRRSGDVTASSSDVTPTSSESDDDDAPVLVIPRTSRSDMLPLFTTSTYYLLLLLLLL